MQFSSPVINTQKVETVESVEPYISEPFIPTTEITYVPKIKRASTSDVEIIGVSSDQCVVFARAITGNEKIKGYAGNLQPEGQEPRIGAIALERSVGHVSVLTDILPDGRLVLKDANWDSGYITKRIVSPESERGYIY